MKARIVFELPLPEGFEPYLEVIAKVHGYSETEFPNVTAGDYLLKQVCTAAVAAMFQTMITNALSVYYGLAGEEQVKAIQAQYMDTHTVVAEIVDA
jgi:hypothetical protein